MYSIVVLFPITRINHILMATLKHCYNVHIDAWICKSNMFAFGHKNITMST